MRRAAATRARGARPALYAASHYRGRLVDRGARRRDVGPLCGIRRRYGCGAPAAAAAIRRLRGVAAGTTAGRGVGTTARVLDEGARRRAGVGAAHGPAPAGVANLPRDDIAVHTRP